MPTQATFTIDALTAEMLTLPSDQAAIVLAIGFALVAILRDASRTESDRRESGQAIGTRP